MKLKHTSFSIKSIMILLIIMVISGTVLAFMLVSREYQKLQNTDIKAVYEEILPAEESTLQEINYPLLNGWNLISFPVETLAFTTASELIRDIADNGGFVTTVATWQGDQWQVFTHNGTDQYGIDFPIEQGKAYFLRSYEPYTWKVYGTSLKKMPNRTLQAGWNAVGLVGFEGKSAENILDILAKGSDTAHEIDWWQSGSWDAFIKRAYGPENTQVYGNNFTINSTHGYMINLTKETTLEVEP